MNFDPGFLIASMLISSVGFVFWSYGKKQRRLPYSVVAVVLMVYPYFVSNVVLMVGIGVVLIALLAVSVLLLGM